MAEPSDRWYVRLPDGRVIRAKSTKSLRYHIRSGRIPVHARVRRSPAEEWTALEWVDVHKGDVSNRVAFPQTNKAEFLWLDYAALSPDHKIIAVPQLQMNTIKPRITQITRTRRMI